MLWNPAGWVELAIGGLTLIVSLAKALWGLFSKEYKKSQQRKAADENISRVVKSMQEAMKTSHNPVMELVKSRIGEIAAEVKRSVEQVANINFALIRVNSELVRVSANTTKFSKIIPEAEEA